MAVYWRSSRGGRNAGLSALSVGNAPRVRAGRLLCRREGRWSRPAEGRPKGLALTTASVAVTPTHDGGGAPPGAPGCPWLFARDFRSSNDVVVWMVEMDVQLARA